MPSLAHYDRETGVIRGVWTAAERAVLAAQQRDDDPTQGYVFFDEIEPGLAQERYEVCEGRVIPRTELTFMADLLTFAADGLTECVIRLVPFVPCTVLVGEFTRETAVVLSQDDEQLVLTADVPEVFTIRLQPQAGYWATPLRVEAV